MSYVDQPEQIFQKFLLFTEWLETFFRILETLEQFPLPTQRPVFAGNTGTKK